MATTTSTIETSQKVDLDIDLPENRTYNTEANADLDEALVDAIAKAERAGNSFLVRLLSRELGSHYYGTR